MPPRGLTNPAPKTESAREARKSFYCELCGKGYARMNEFEAHEGSYDHLHTKRLKEMKQMSRDPSARSKALRAERRADEKSGLGIITIKPLGTSGVTAPTALEGATPPTGTGKGKGFKKGGFRNAFGGGGEDGGGSGGGGGVGTGKGEGEVKEEEEKGDVKMAMEIDVEMKAAGGDDGDGDVDVDEDVGESENDESVYVAEGGRYDPRRPTGCEEGCRERREGEGEGGGGGWNS